MVGQLFNLEVNLETHPITQIKHGQNSSHAFEPLVENIALDLIIFAIFQRTENHFSQVKLKLQFIIDLSSFSFETKSC